jgi:cellulose biosynthesis protein BcsQ
MKCIVIANIAGGVGKSTSAHAISVAATEYGKKVLLIDADPASATTFLCGVENPRASTKEFLAKELSLESAIVRTSERFALLPSASRLSSLDIDIAISIEALRESLSEYELVIIDTATGPNRVMTYLSGLADLFVIPTTEEILSIRGALHAKNFAAESGYTAQNLLIVTMQSDALAPEVFEQLSQDFEVLEPAIREDRHVFESQMSGRSVLSLHNQSAVSADYREITYTLLEKLELI